MLLPRNLLWVARCLGRSAAEIAAANGVSRDLCVWRILMPGIDMHYVHIERNQLPRSRRRACVWRSGTSPYGHRGSSRRARHSSEKSGAPGMIRTSRPLPLEGCYELQVYALGARLPNRPRQLLSQRGAALDARQTLTSHSRYVRNRVAPTERRIAFSPRML